MNVESSDSDATPSGGYAFGTFKGVFTPSILTILGVIMYLRFGWVLGNVGLALTLVIVVMATAITFLTGLSLAALATNMKVGGGGAYYIISRSLGIETGAAVGLPLYLAQSLGISFYIAGFAEAVVQVFPDLPVKTVAVVTLVVLTAVAYFSADLALRTQYLVMAIIGLSLISFFAGGASEPAAIAAPSPDVSLLPFWTVFAVFFPAVTGIEAGIAMSGDLKDPARSLPRGTIAAVGVGLLTYLAIPVFMSTRGLSSDELINNSLIMRDMARWGPIVVLGVWAASLSSAVGALLGAPRTLQALARDRIVPAVIGRGYGPGKDPRLATALSFGVALTGILLGDLNIIAPVLSMFFLTSYGLLNASAALGELSNMPSWRPTFRVPAAVSLLGAFGCLAVMVMINPGATFIATAFVFSIYFIMQRRSLTAQWGDMRRGFFVMLARFALFKLAAFRPDERTWKPNILVLAGSPRKRWHLVELAAAMAGRRGIITLAAVVPESTEPERVQQLTKTIDDYLVRRDVDAFVKVFPAPTPGRGAELLTAAYGFGPITPNTVLIGTSNDPERTRAQAVLLSTIHHQRQNLILVHEPDADDDLSLVALGKRGRRRGRNASTARIDVWWRGEEQNIGLMLALAVLVQRCNEWRGASLVLKTIVPEVERAVAEERMRAFIESRRLDAEAEVLVADGTDRFDLIRRSSSGATLALLGMRAPADDEPADSYADYHAVLLKNARGMPVTAFVLASQRIDFRAIFGEL